MAYLFRYVAGLLAALVAFAGFLLIRYPLHRFTTAGPVAVFCLSAIFLFFALWNWNTAAFQKKPLAVWKIVCLVVFFFLLFKVLIVLLLIAGQS